MIEVVITGQDAAIARFEGMPEKVRAKIRESMQRWWFRLQAQVVQSKLSGDPLRRRTGVLASSINVGGTDTVTSFTEDDTSFVGRVGTKVKYGAVHENGGAFSIPEHTRRITQAFGRPIAPVDVTVSAHTARFPQRSFLRSTLRDMSTQIREGIKADIAKATAEI